MMLMILLLMQLLQSTQASTQGMARSGNRRVWCQLQAVVTAVTAIVAALVGIRVTIGPVLFVREQS